MGEAAIDTERELARRQRVEDGLSLRVTALAPHRSFGLGFRAAGELCRPVDAPGEAPETVSWSVAIDDAFAGWTYFEHRRSGVVEPVAAYSIALVAVEHPFGSKWRFQCADGFGLCAALHLPPGAARFASRQAHRLVYRSQAMSPRARAAEQAMALRQALGGAADLGMPCPPRPRLMRRAVYERHRREIEALTVEAGRRRVIFSGAGTISTGGHDVCSARAFI